MPGGAGPSGAGGGPRRRSYVAVSSSGSYPTSLCVHPGARVARADVHVEASRWSRRFRHALCGADKPRQTRGVPEPASVGLLAAVAFAFLGPAPVVDTPPEGTDAPPPTSADPGSTVQRPSQPTQPAVSDAAWTAVQGRQVVIETATGPVEGELTGTEGDTLVIIASDGRVLTVPKHAATGLRVVKAETAAPTATPSSSPEARELSSLDPPSSTTNREGRDAGGDEADTDDRKARREEKRKQRGFAILGAWTAQGATYTHWRGDGIDDGHASYAMDFAVGANLTQGFGMYVVGGGLLGTRLEDARVNANYGRLAFLFLLGGKYYFSTLGAGVGFSRLKWKDPVPFDDLQKDVGLAIPFKIVGKIPLPKNLYIGIGLTYEFAAVRKFSRFINGIGGQIVLGRW